MSNHLTALLSRAFVAAYVVGGYVRYYSRRISLRTFIIISLIIAMIAGLTANFLLKPQMNGNDALNRGYDLANNGQLNAAHKAFDDAYQIFRKESYGRGMFVALGKLGEIDERLSNPREALFHYDAALRLAQQYNDTGAQITLFKKHADIKLRLNRFDAARAHLYDALKIAQDTENHEQVGLLFTRVGNLERDIGNDRRARFLYRQASDTYQNQPNTAGQANLNWNLGILEAGVENYDASLREYITARELYKIQNDTYREAVVVHHMARLEKKLGTERKAAAYYNEAATLYASIGRNEDVKSLKTEAAELLS
jgi:tetratricopeptide (TPR) repeat protein